MPKGQTTTKACNKCNEEISLFSFTRHSKSCDGSGKRKQSVTMIPENLICIFCNKLCKNKLGYSAHIRMCKSNPLARDNPRKGKPGCNQYTKAKELGLPKPILKPETKEKNRLARLKQQNSYYSKESQIVIEKVLNLLNDTYYGNVYYATKNREFFLRYNNKNYCYDLCFSDLKILIEYNGITYHLRNLSEDWKPPFKSMGSKFDVFIKDQIKKEAAEFYGYKIYYIWSDNVENDIKDVVANVKFATIV